MNKELIIENSKFNMNFESTLFSLSQKNFSYKIYIFPVIVLNNPVKRSGDNKVIYALTSLDIILIHCLKWIVYCSFSI